VHILARVFGNELCGTCDLKNVVKAAAVKSADYVIYIFKLIELTVQCGCGQCYFVFIIAEFFKRVVYRALCVIGADPYTFAAVDAPLVTNDRFAVSDTDSLCRTALNAMRTTLAQICLKCDRMMYSAHINLQKTFILIIGVKLLPP
jgi:hypothetical protein